MAVEIKVPSVGESITEGVLSRWLKKDGDAVRSGIRGALGERILFMDADGSHNPSQLRRLWQAREGTDLVIGSRYLNGSISVVNWPLTRIILSAFANRYVRLVTGLKTYDCTSGYRCWRRESLARLPLDAVISEGYAFLVETLYLARRLGCRIREVPIIFVERRQGTSKLSGRVLMESIVVPWRLRLKS